MWKRISSLWSALWPSVYPRAASFSVAENPYLNSWGGTRTLSQSSHLRRPSKIPYLLSSWHAIIPTSQQSYPRLIDSFLTHRIGRSHVISIPSLGYIKTVAPILSDRSLSLWSPALAEARCHVKKQPYDKANGVRDRDPTTTTWVSLEVDLPSFRWAHSLYWTAWLQPHERLWAWSSPRSHTQIPDPQKLWDNTCLLF